MVQRVGEIGIGEVVEILLADPAQKPTAALAQPCCDVRALAGTEAAALVTTARASGSSTVRTTVIARPASPSMVVSATVPRSMPKPSAGLLNDPNTMNDDSAEPDFGEGLKVAGVDAAHFEDLDRRRHDAPHSPAARSFAS